jgi:hypothetical protein
VHRYDTCAAATAPTPPSDCPCRCMFSGAACATSPRIDGHVLLRSWWGSTSGTARKTHNASPSQPGAEHTSPPGFLVSCVLVQEMVKSCLPGPPLSHFRRQLGVYLLPKASDTHFQMLSEFCCQSYACMPIALEGGRDQARRSRYGLLLPREHISTKKRLAGKQKSSGRRIIYTLQAP